MFGDIFKKKQRLSDFLADSAKGFLLILRTGKRLTAINLLLLLLQSVLPLLSLLVIKNLIDHAQKNGINWHQTGIDLALFSLLQLLTGIISQYSGYRLSEQQQLITDNMSATILKKAIELDLEYFENPEFYDDLTMAQQQSLGKTAQLITAYQGLVQNFIAIVLYTGFMFLAHWTILLLIILLSIPLALSKLMHGYHQFEKDKECMPAQRKASSIFQYLTTDTYAKEVRIFGYGANFTEQFLHLRKFIFNKKKQLQFQFLKQNIFIQLFEIILTSVIYCIIIAGAVTGAITIGGLVIYFQVFQKLQSSITGLFQAGINLFQNQLYLKQISEYLSSPALVKDQGEGHFFPVLKNGIVVKNLNFTYPNTVKQVLTDINMELRPGTITAIAGENGSGKSTLIKLLCRFYETEPTTILIDGISITAIQLNELRKNVTVLFQDFGKYYMTIEDNIAPGINKKDKKQLESSAEKAGLMEKIESFDMGFKTQLGRTFNKGEQLSGGQWQKIALARMFYKDSPILILDEPTSSMDPIAEHNVFQNIKKSIGNKIVILITHRLYNLKLADNIYLMADGKVTEQGTYEQLLKIKGDFAAIYGKQKI